jgi:hypothetical protein
MILTGDAPLLMHIMISHHRACSAVVESFSGGPTDALRALADEIDATDNKQRINPKGSHA